MKTAVALVLNDSFEEELELLASRMPVWIIESTPNEVLVEKLRMQKEKYNITVFFNERGQSKSDLFSDIIYTLDEHHNEISQRPPYQTLYVYGLDLESIDKNILRELGFVQFMGTEYGFVVEK